MHIYLAEHQSQAQGLLEQKQAQPGIWVALGPGAMHFLHRQGIPFTIPEDYLSREAVAAACHDQYARLSQACRLLDDKWRNHNDFLAAWGINPFFFHLWQLAQVTDTLLSRVLILQEIFSRHPGATAHVHLAPPQPFAGFGLGFSQKETLWGRLLTLPGWEAGVEIVPQENEKVAEPFAGSGPGNFSRRQRLRTFLAAHPRLGVWLYSLGVSWRQGWGRNLANILGVRPNGAAPSLLVCNAPYEWSSILPQLITQGHPVYFLSSHLLAQESGASAQTSGDPSALSEWFWEAFRSHLGPRPVDFTPLLLDRVQFIADRAVPQAQAVVDSLGRVFKGKNLRALLLSSCSDYRTYVVKQYYRQRRIPVIAWQHGAQWNDNGLSQHCDLLDAVGCDHLLVAGEGVKAGYERSYLAREAGCAIHAAGLPSLETLHPITPAPGGSPGDQRILWVFGGYYGNGWYCGFSPPTSDRVYYQEQMEILFRLREILEEFPRAKVTIKLYPSEYCNENPPWAPEAAKVPRVALVYDQPNFVGLLPSHDLVIIDSPTTTLLQAASTQLPLFVLMSVIRWPEQAIRLLQKRGFCAGRAQELMSGVQQFLRQGAYPADVHNQKFLQQYGTHQGQGQRLALTLLERTFQENGRR